MNQSIKATNTDDVCDQPDAEKLSELMADSV